MGKGKHSRADDYRDLPPEAVAKTYFHVNPGSSSAGSSGTIPVGPHMMFGVTVGEDSTQQMRDGVWHMMDRARDFQEQAFFLEHGLEIGDVEAQRRISSARTVENQTRLRDLQGRNIDVDIIVDSFKQQHNASLADYNVKLREYQEMCSKLHKSWTWHDPLKKTREKLERVLEAKYRLEADQAILDEVRVLASKKQRIQPPPPSSVPIPPPPTVVASASVAASSSRDDRYARIDTLSALFETSGRHHDNCDGKCCQPGACCISSGYLDRGKTKKDPGGKSYGRHQFASASEIGTLQRFLHDNPVIERDFSGLAIGSDAFDRKWIEMSHQDNFVKAQDKFIVKTNFTPVRKTANEVHLLNTEIIDQILYSCGVQHGPGGANQIVRNAARELESTGKLNDEQMTILCVYKHRAAYIDGIPDTKISPECKNQLKQNRCVEEREAALKMFAEKQSPALERPPAVVAQGMFRSQQDGEEAKKEVAPASSSAPAVDATPACR